MELSIEKITTHQDKDFIGSYLVIDSLKVFKIFDNVADYKKVHQLVNTNGNGMKLDIKYTTNWEVPQEVDGCYLAIDGESVAEACSYLGNDDPETIEEIARDFVDKLNAEG